ncbi:MAG TPA: TonB-dependent receptor [Granulicella sp.]|jgi:hypothetical protein|nr:TonB-dependent receptor [Granulicella sp.]
MKNQFDFGQFVGHLCSTIILLGVLSVPTVGLAQTDTGRVTGTVTDATGSVLPNTTVTLVNADTGATQTMTSDAAGNFNFVAVVRGNYHVDATKSGFKTTEQAFELQVSQVQTIQFQLAVGGSNETVEVTDAAPIVDLSTSSTGTVLESKQISELPLNGRNFTQLALLVPGVTRGAYGDAASGVGGNVETQRNSETGGAALSANGLRQQANNFELDGVDNNESLVNTIVFFPPVEATQEFRVNTSVAAAEFGRAGGAIVQSSIKSGTNQFHGSAFLFDRDAIFDANPNYFGGGAKPSFHRTQFGGTLGGPIWRNKIFLFGDYQGLREKTPTGGSFQTVPTALMRTGNFSELLLASSGIKTSAPLPGMVGACHNLPPTTVNAGANGAGAIYDPLTCAQWNYNGQPNVVDPSRISRAGLNYLNAFPLPNVPGATTTNNYFVNPSQTQRFDDFDVRADATITQRDSVFVRYSYGEESIIKQSLFTALPAGYGSGTNTNHPRGVAAGYTHIFSPNVVNEFRYGYLRPYYAYINPMEGIPVSANLGIVNANRNALLGGGAAINGNGDLAYTGDYGPYEVPQKSNQFIDNLSINHGQHSFRFGVNIMKREVKFFQGNNSKGYFGFARDFTGFTQSDMLTGFTDDYAIGVASSYFDTKSWEMGYFAQDDWKISRRLTLNLGVRYDLYTHPYEQNNQQSNFDTTTGTLLEAGVNGNSRALVNNNYNNFAPRVGFAYDLTGKGTSSLRGGYGIYYFLDRGGVNNQLSENPDYNGTSSFQAVNGYRMTFMGQNPLAATPNNNSTQATSPLPLPVMGQTVNLLNPVGTNLISQDPHSPTSMVQQWNLQLQQQLDHVTSLNIAYVGTKADHLSTWFNLNDQILNAPYNSKLYPALGSIDRGINEGASNYNGLQIFLQRQMSAGVQLTAAYTWSHTMDDSGGAFSTPGHIFIFPTGPNLKTNYGNSDQDMRNVFNFSALANLPFGRGKLIGTNVARPVDYLIGGWQVNTIVTLTSGQPFDITSQLTTLPGGGSASVAPGNVADRVGPTIYTKTLHQWMSPSSFTSAPAVSFNGGGYVFTRPGTLGRNQVFGPSYRNMDLSLFKNVPIKDGVVGQFRAEAFNLMNTPEFTNPNGNLDTLGQQGGFGQITTTRAYSERQMEFAFRVTF